MCPSVRDVWSECSRKASKFVSEISNFTNLVEFMMDRLSEEEVVLATIVARQIWLRRNAFVHEGKFSSPASLIRFVKDQMEAHTVAEKNVWEMRESTRQCSHTKWRPPPKGTVKVNWDVLVDKLKRRVGYGVIIRNHGGKVVAMLCETQDHI
jgi:hypothetical protein